jgi:AsmA protein
VKVTDGALIGWDVNAMIGGLGGLARGEVPSTRRQADARTPFRQLSGTFQIANGVARTRDMALDSPTLVASGAGTVNIVDRNLDLTFKPKIPGSGLEVPVRVAGSWEDPSVIPDVAAALNSPQAKEAIRQLKDGDVDGALKSVLGSGAKGEKQLDKAKELLRGIFRQ